MSYSFSIRETTKEAVLQKLTAKFDEILAAQPSHSFDREQAQGAAEAFLFILPEAHDKDFCLVVNGSVSWNGKTGVDAVLMNADVNISAGLATKGI